MFLHHMPTAVRTALASSKATSNDDLAADEVMQEFPLASQSTFTPYGVTAISSTTQNPGRALEVNASFRPRGSDRPRP